MDKSHKNNVHSADGSKDIDEGANTENKSLATPSGKCLTNMKDLKSYLQNCFHNFSCPYDHILQMIRGINEDDDGIESSNKIKFIAIDFCNIVRDENILSECIAYLNEKALRDSNTTKKFALVFSSRKFSELSVGGKTIRSEMVKKLNKNYLDSNTLRECDRTRLYNSITLLGEYYQRARLVDNVPIHILGQSLLELLIQEVSDIKYINDVQLAKLLLTQISINRDILRGQWSKELSNLLYIIRKNMIEQNLQPTIKAFMLMTLDVYYTNLSQLGSELEGMYMKYLMMTDKNGEEGAEGLGSVKGDGDAGTVKAEEELENVGVKDKVQENGENQPPQLEIMLPCPSFSSFYLEMHSKSEAKSNNNGYDKKYNAYLSCNNVDNGDCLNDGLISENNLNQEENEVVNPTLFSSSKAEEDNAVSERCENHCISTEAANSAPFGFNYDDQYTDDDNAGGCSGYDQLNYSRKLSRQYHDTYNIYNDNIKYGSHDIEVKLSEESKPLPRWRAPRFNRNTHGSRHRKQTPVNNDNNQKFNTYVRRHDIDFRDDDTQRTYGDDNNGGIRLYSVYDRMKHAQDKIDFDLNRNAYNTVANSNWDCSSEHDARSERSYKSNTDSDIYPRQRDDQQYSSMFHHSNYNSYAKPPRFQRHQKNTEQNSDPNRNNEIGEIMLLHEPYGRHPDENEGENGDKNDQHKMRMNYDFAGYGLQTLPKCSKYQNKNIKNAYSVPKEIDRRSRSLVNKTWDYKNFEAKPKQHHQKAKYEYIDEFNNSTNIDEANNEEPLRRTVGRMNLLSIEK